MVLLQLAVNIGPVFQLMCVVLLGIGGMAMVCYSLMRSLSIAHREAALIDEDGKNSTDLRIPRGYGQYTAIRILPAVKKITSRTDLFI